MFTQSFFLSRSKSDNHIQKVNVLSPKPVREQNISFLDEITRLSNFQRKVEDIEGGEPCKGFIIRKNQSMGVLNVGSGWLDSFCSQDSKTEDLPAGSKLDDLSSEEALRSSDHPIEIPERVSNPIVNDQKFRESDDEDATLNYNLNNNADISHCFSSSLHYIQTLVQN